jgi:hypothetical protein
VLVPTRSDHTYVADWQADNAICIHLWKYCVYCHWVGLRRSGAAAEQVNRGSPERPKTNQRRITLVLYRRRAFVR